MLVEGIIERYVAVLDPAKAAMDLMVFKRVWQKGQDAETVNRFTDAIKQLPQVVACHLMAGDCGFLLRVIAADLDGYRQFQTWWTACSVPVRKERMPSVAIGAGS